MARHALNGELSFKWHGHWTFLRDIIAHSRLPRDHDVEGVSLDWLVQRLEAFPPREIFHRLAARRRTHGSFGAQGGEE